MLFAELCAFVQVRMKPRIVLSSPRLPGLLLESIDDRHLELLRRWKNEARHRFFFQTEISAARQRDWYSGYCSQPGDWMFLIRTGDQIAGCIGYRILEGVADVYNVLRAGDLDRRSTALANALDLLTNYIAQTHDGPIRGQVLADNPVHRWARQHGFRTIGRGVKDGLAYVILEQDPQRRVAFEIVVERTGGVTEGVGERLP